VGTDTGAAILVGNGDGTFQQPVMFILLEPPSFVMAADFNLDGKPDIAVLYYDYYNGSSKEVTVPTNTTP